MAKVTSAIVWQGTSMIDGGPIVMIVTGLGSGGSANRKTGDMVQTWILRSDVDPIAAMKLDLDRSICGDCPLRGYQDQDSGKRVGRACYVNVGQAPLSIYRAYARGSYPVMDPADVAELIAGRGIRLGSYGDPSLVPLQVLQDLVSTSKVRTGYTHQWRNVDPGYRELLMASADTVTDRRDARLAGWRSFVVLPTGADRPERAVECAATREVNKLTCFDCGMCSGVKAGKVATDVFILAHGTGSKYVTA